VRPTQSFHRIECADDGCVQSIEAIRHADVWMNAGYFVLNREIFHEMRSGDELVVEPFERLIQKQRLFTLQYDGFYACMDTFKEKQLLDEMVAAGESPWEVWRKPLDAPRVELPPRTNGRITTRLPEGALTLPRTS